jgi:serine/threonine-protein kinase
MTDLLERLTQALADRYRIERELGSGGMAIVYLAEDLKHHRQVAIKVLRPELAANLGAERFVREIEIAANLTHPHILPLFDSGEADGFLYYVMPYIEGESLRDRLEREGALGIDETIRLTEQVASALAYAHERGVVHRDVKPENVLLTGDQAIVADFGIARAVEAAGGEKLTGTGLAIGTPAYMSPEQWLGAGQVDAKTDIYALGCVVFEMVGGRPPFEGTTPQELLAKHAAETIPQLRSSDPAIPLFVERAVEKALAKNPDDRFATVSAFAEALTRGVVVPRVRARRRERRRKAIAASAGIAVGALAVWALFTVLPGARIERLAVLPLVDLANDPEQEYLAAGVHEALIAELGQLGLSVTARATMAQYRETDKPIGAIADELGVDGVIEGSVFRGGDSLEITARLYDGDEQEIWSGTFDGVLSNVVALYRGFARAIAGEIELRLSPAAEERLGEGRDINPNVYEAYLRGMHLLNKPRTEENLDLAIAYFERAVEQNPADPLAYAGLALAYATIGHGFAPPDDAWPRARAAAERAIRLDSTLAEGWAALADYKSYAEGDWEGAERAFRRANELNPSLAMNHYHYAWYLALFGRTAEALAEHRRAQELDPLTPLHTLWIPALYRYSEEPDAAEQALTEARLHVEQYPNHGLAWSVLAGCARRAALFDEAQAAEERALALNPGDELGWAEFYARAGRREDALRIVEKSEALPPNAGNALGLAWVYKELGNQDKALRWLDYEPHHAFVAWNVGWSFREYRDDPRFQAIVRRLNLEHVPGQRAPRPLPMEERPLAGTEDTR